MHFSIFETIYTPQGDGNADVHKVERVIFGNNLHPARGRKFHETVTTADFFAETTYTQQGDGNCAIFIFIFLQNRNNLHPARGRKLHAFV